VKNHIRPIGIDLFAGVGGLSLGFEQAGFDIAAAVEIDPIHCATHAYNFPHSPTICASVVQLTGAEIRQRAGLEPQQSIDVVFGGAPCQGFSLIGKRNLDDPRNHLVFHYVRLVQELQPKYCVFENVQGLTLGKHAKFLAELIAALQQAGYDVLDPYQVLNAADFGVPQNRRRLFLIGSQRGQTPPQYPLPLATTIKVWDAIGDLPDAEDFEELWRSDAVPTDWDTISDYGQRLRGITPDPQDFSYPRSFDRAYLTSSIRTKHSDIARERFLGTAPGKTEPHSRFRKLDPTGLCNTLRAGTDSARGAFTSPRPIHPFLPRLITVREAARLHSYPDWFRFHATKWHGCRQIGNSVPPLLGRAVASAILQAMQVSPQRPTEMLPLGAVGLLNLKMSGAAQYFGVARDVIPQRLKKTAITAVLEPSVD
jgi:DNA (cytosine-5)-methyltransferase 1